VPAPAAFAWCVVAAARDVARTAVTAVASGLGCLPRAVAGGGGFAFAAADGLGATDAGGGSFVFADAGGLAAAGAAATARFGAATGLAGAAAGFEGLVRCVRPTPAERAASPPS